MHCYIRLKEWKLRSKKWLSNQCVVGAQQRIVAGPGTGAQPGPGGPGQSGPPSSRQLVSIYPMLKYFTLKISLYSCILNVSIYKHPRFFRQRSIWLNSRVIFYSSIREEIIIILISINKACQVILHSFWLWNRSHNWLWCFRVGRGLPAACIPISEINICINEINEGKEKIGHE